MIVLNNAVAEIAEKGSIPLMSINAAIPRRKVTMATRASISKRRRDVMFSGSKGLSVIFLTDSWDGRNQRVVACRISPKLLSVP